MQGYAQPAAIPIGEANSPAMRLVSVVIDAPIQTGWAGPVATLIRQCAEQVLQSKSPRDPWRNLPLSQ